MSKQRFPDMSENVAEAKYCKVYKEMIKKFGHDGMTRTGELETIGNQLFKNKFLGAFAQDKLPEEIYDSKPGKSGFADVKYAIINIDTSGMPGTHWVAVAGLPNSKKIMVFDSFGRASKTLLPILHRKSNSFSKGGVIDTDRDAEQRRIQDSCGQFSMAWLKFLEKYGFKNAKKI